MHPRLTDLPLFGPSLKNATASVQNDQMIRFSAAVPIREIVLPTLTETELRERCESFKLSSDPYACGRANTDAVRQLRRECGTPLHTCFVLVTGGVVMAMGGRGEIIQKWEEMEHDPLFEYTTYKPLDSSATSREMLEQMLPLELPDERNTASIDTVDQRLQNIEIGVSLLLKRADITLPNE